MNFLTTNRMITILATVAVIAVISRVEPAKDLVFGDKKFLGIF